MDEDTSLLNRKRTRIKEHYSRFLRKVNLEHEGMLAVLNITPFCNSNCVFCSEGEREKRMLSTEEVREFIGKLSLRGVDKITFMGGETTLRPDFLDVLKLVKSKGMLVTVVTNGLKFKDTHFCNITLPYIDRFEFSFHFHNRKICRRITGNDSFPDIIRALDNIRRFKKDMGIFFNVVMNSINYPHLKKISKILVAFNFTNSMIHFKSIKISGRVISNPHLVPRYSSLNNHLISAFDFCIKNKIDFMFEGIPFCMLEDYACFSRDSLNSRFDVPFFCMNKSTISGNESAEDYRIRNAKREYIGSCTGCNLRGFCPGIRREYLGIHGDSEFKRRV